MVNVLIALCRRIFVAEFSGRREQQSRGLGAFDRHHFAFGAGATAFRQDLQEPAELDSDLAFKRVTFKVKGDGDAELLAKLCQLSPVFDTLARPVDIRVSVEKV